MQASPDRVSLFGKWSLRVALVALCLSLPMVGSSCTGTVLPFLQHLKRPLSMATAINSEDGERYLYVANADLDRIALVHVGRRSLLIDPDPATPGIYLIQTGRYPVDLAVTSDQKRMYVLHGIEGNIGAIDLSKYTQVLDNGAPMRLPRGCKGRCWRNPKRMLLHEADGKLRAFVAIPAENAVAVVELSQSGDAAKDFGKEIKRFRLSGTPLDLFRAEGTDIIYATNGRSHFAPLNATAQRKSSFLHAIDAKKLTVQNIKLCESVVENGETFNQICGPTGKGSVSNDGRWVYVIDQETGGIRIYDAKDKKTVNQGDTRFPNQATIQAPDGAAFLSVGFLPETTVTIKNDKGEDLQVTKAFAWATATDGFGYIIDTDKHALLDTDQRGPTTQDFAMFVGTDSVGTPRDPIREDLPKLKLDPSNSDDTGVKVFDGKTRTERWTLTYEGTILSGRTGRFSSQNKDTFSDAQSRDLTRDGVQKGDILLLENCTGTSAPAPDGGAPDADPQSTACELEILEIDKHQMKVDLKDKNVPQRDQWTFSIRSKAGTFLVRGSVSGVQAKRLEEGKLYTNDFFELTLEKGAKTPRDTRIEFSTISGFVVARVTLGGLPSRLLAVPSHSGCTRCDTDSCREHPSCTKTKCVTGSTDKTTQCGADEFCNKGECIPQNRLWFLDPTSSRLFVVNPLTLSTENTIR